MKLKIVSTNGILFEGDVTEVVVPTKEGEAGILPGHAPYTAVIKGGLCKFKETQHKDDFIRQGDYSIVSVGDGLVYTDGKEVHLAVSQANAKLEIDEEELLKMKEKLEKEIEEIKAKGSIEEIEKALLEMNKLLADLELVKIKKKMY